MYLPVMSPLRDFFGQARWGGKPVVTVFGAPDRAHTEAARVFKRRLSGKTDDQLREVGLTRQQVEDGLTPVPFFSIWRSQPVFDQARDTRAIFRGFNVNQKAGTALKMRFPRAMQSDIQVDLWCGEAGTKIAEVVSAQIEMLFPHESVYLPVDWSLSKWYKPPFDVFEHAKVYGRTRGRLVQTQGWTDNTSLEYGDGPKEVRLTWAGRWDFYLPYRPEEGRIVRDVTFELIDETTNDLLETLDISTED